MFRLVFSGIALLLVAMLLDLSLIVYATYAIVGVLLICKLITTRWSEDVVAERFAVRTEAEVDQHFSVALKIKHHGKLPIAWLLVEDMLEKRCTHAKQPAFQISGDRIALLQMAPGQEHQLEYQVKCKRRGYYQIGPIVIETGDLFGLNRRFRVLTDPVYVTVYPRIHPVVSYDIASRRPIGEVVMTHRLFEDPTRIAGVREYQDGDSLSRVHWRATARTGKLQCKVYEPSTLAGATLLVDFREDSFATKDEPVRSELAIECAASIADTLHKLGQQVGLVSNGSDAVDRIRTRGWRGDQRTRDAAKQSAQMSQGSDRLNPVIVPTTKSPEQFSKILTALSRLELSEGLEIAELVVEAQSRLPRDATVIAIISRIDVANAIALGGLVRQGYSVEVIVNCYSDEEFIQTSGPLLNEGIHCRHLRAADSISSICEKQAIR